MLLRRGWCRRDWFRRDWCRRDNWYFVVVTEACLAYKCINYAECQSTNLDSDIFGNEFYGLNRDFHWS